MLVRSRLPFSISLSLLRLLFLVREASPSLASAFDLLSREVAARLIVVLGPVEKQPLLKGFTHVVEDGVGLDHLGDLCEGELRLAGQQDEVLRGFGRIQVHIVIMTVILSSVRSPFIVLVEVLAHDGPREHLIRLTLVKFDPWFLLSCLGILFEGERLLALVLDELHEVVRARLSPMIPEQHLVHGLDALQVSLAMLGNRKVELVHSEASFVGVVIKFTHDVVIPHVQQRVNDVEYCECVDPRIHLSLSGVVFIYVSTPRLLRLY